MYGMSSSCFAFFAFSLWYAASAWTCAWPMHCHLLYSGTPDLCGTRPWPSAAAKHQPVVIMLGYDKQTPAVPSSSLACPPFIIPPVFQFARAHCSAVSFPFRWLHSCGARLAFWADQRTIISIFSQASNSLQCCYSAAIAMHSFSSTLSSCSSLVGPAGSG